jgi:hypothetical protein
MISFTSSLFVPHVVTKPGSWRIPLERLRRVRRGEAQSPQLSHRSTICLAPLRCIWSTVQISSKKAAILPEGMRKRPVYQEHGRFVGW